MEAVKVNVSEMTAKIDLKRNRIYVVKDGEITPVNPPETGFGEQTAVWNNGKVIRLDERSTRKI